MIDAPRAAIFANKVAHKIFFFRKFVHTAGTRGNLKRQVVRRRVKNRNNCFP